MGDAPIIESYVDALGRRRTVAPEVRAAVLATMRGSGAREGTPVVIARPGEALPEAGELRLEDGTELGRVSAIPRDAPYGYHRLLTDAGEALVISGPGRCHLPAGLREWGWAIQLAATRSRRSWGIGDLADLATLCDWTASVGGGFVAVGPLSAPNLAPSPEPSPYYPSTRRFGNPLHLAVEALAGGIDVADLAVRARALNERRRIDRAAVQAFKLEALERIWRGRAYDAAAFDRWRRERGEPLERWARFCALTERLGPGWPSWPEELRRPGSGAVARAAPGDRVAFHAWLQWCFDRQLAEASGSVRRLADLPVGFDPEGFDAWDWQDELAMAARIGAPPDRFAMAGQDWGLPPFIPARLRAAGYRPFIETLRAALRHAGGLRIDHALGLFRLWWVPLGHSAADGAYVRYPTDETLEIVALESDRAGAIVVGEDLGTVPRGVRTELRRRRLLSTRLALFEPSLPARYPRQSYAGVTTHDLPTIAGLWTGVDLERQAAAGLEPDPDGATLLRRRLARAAGVSAGASVEEVTEALHRRLAAAPPMLLAATLEDALGVTERPNLPGTHGEDSDNWSLALPVPIEDFGAKPRVGRIVAALAR